MPRKLVHKGVKLPCPTIIKRVMVGVAEGPLKGASVKESSTAKVDKSHLEPTVKIDLEVILLQ